MELACESHKEAKSQLTALHMREAIMIAVFGMRTQKIEHF